MGVTKNRLCPQKRKKNSSINWQETAKKLDEKFQALQEDHARLEKAYEELKKYGLGDREAVQLRRLKHLHNQIVNIQVCSDCKVVFDRLLKDATHIK